MAYSQWYTKGKYLRPSDIINGILGALVAITPTCASVHTYVALVIGVVGSLVACFVNDWLMFTKLKLDDPVGAVGVHVGGAVWGIIAVGLFADGSLPGIGVRDGLFYGGGFVQLGVQILAIAAVWAWSFGIMFPFFWLAGIVFGGTWQNPRKGLRLDFVDGDHHQADIHLHNCLEDPTGKLLSEVDNFMRRESRKSGNATVLGIRIPRKLTRKVTHQAQDETEEVWDADSDESEVESPNDVNLEESHPGEASGDDESQSPQDVEGEKQCRRGRFQLFASTRRL